MRHAAFFLVFAIISTASCIPEVDTIRSILAGYQQVMSWVQASLTSSTSYKDPQLVKTAAIECAMLLNDTSYRLELLLAAQKWDDAVCWLSAAVANHRTCTEGMETAGVPTAPTNLTTSLKEALALFTRTPTTAKSPEWQDDGDVGFLGSWDKATPKADFVVAKDGSGTHKTVNEAMAAVERMGRNRPGRMVIYVKSGVYKENVEIKRDTINLMLVGDGMEQTIITSSRNVPDGSTTFSSATFGVSGDGFWAKDITFENTAGPGKNQAVALRVNSDCSVFYRCSFRGYQDTLFAHSLRQYYRECRIYGTIDFIFGDAAAVFQSCDILVRRPMDGQSNVVTAQGRDDPDESTAFVIHGCRILPAPDFRAESRFRTFLGRPWRPYSRTLIVKSYIDGMVDPKGWMEWDGDFGLSTLFYAEYMNQGEGAFTGARATWPGFHVLPDVGAATPFSASNFIDGYTWIPQTGVPFWPDI